jgi:hypothetical protein
MRQIPRETLAFLAGILFSWTTALQCGAVDKVVLDHAAIVTDTDQASFVQYGDEERAGYLKESTGNEIPIVSLAQKAMATFYLSPPVNLDKVWIINFLDLFEVEVC